MATKLATALVVAALMTTAPALAIDGEWTPVSGACAPTIEQWRDLYENRFVEAPQEFGGILTVKIQWDTYARRRDGPAPRDSRR